MRLGQPLPVVEPAGAFDADREVMVAEVEPDLDSELAQSVHHCERVVGKSPTSLVDPVGEPERHQIGVRRDIGAVDLDVVARVRDHHQIFADDIEHAARQLGSAGAAGEDDDAHQRSPARPVTWIPARAL